MRVSFNGLRKNLCGTFNDVTRIIEHRRSHPTLAEDRFLQEEFDDKINDLGSIIGILLCIYDDDIDGDLDDLSNDCGVNFLEAE